MKAKSNFSEFVRTLNGSGWAPVSRKMMDDTSLSLAARGVAAWLCTRPDGHRIYLDYALTRLNISKPTWQKIRRELEATGYLQVVQRRVAGRFEWKYFFTDVPTVATSTIAKNSTDGNSTDIEETGGKETGGKETKTKEARALSLLPPQKKPTATQKRHENFHGVAVRSLSGDAAHGHAKDVAEVDALIRLYGVDVVERIAANLAAKHSTDKVFAARIKKELSARI